METIKIAVKRQPKEYVLKLKNKRLIHHDTVNWPKFETEDPAFRDPTKHYLFRFIDQDTNKLVFLLERNSPFMHEISQHIKPFCLLTKKSLEFRISRSNAIGRNSFEDFHMQKSKLGKKMMAFQSQGIQSISFGYRGRSMAGSPPGAFKANHQKKSLYYIIKNQIAPQTAKSYWKVLDKEFGDIYVENSKKIHKSYFIAEPFTTATLNVNAQMACHYDGSNLPKGWSAMPIFYYEQTTEGGEFCVPEFQIKISGYWGDIPYFPAEETLHGNLPIQGKNGKSPLRCSVVLYSLAKLAGLPPGKQLLESLYAKYQSPKKTPEKTQEIDK